ncbi:MAG: ATP-binding protein [Phycisphaeraceae bacterium]|nr:ATP-binding protein [Phycisphaeraceae bacterium]
MADAQPTNPLELAELIRNVKPGGKPVRTPLRTSERVIRRVTDGIYREPWAALRELISNAYDADATKVVISTDAPRFGRVTIRDNGNGFTADSLASMCKSIGGSQKRTQHGADLGITSVEDPDLSPGGRRLIGKLGIGLFAVSQLTQKFRIITKVKGERERTVADMILFRHSEPKSKLRKRTDDEIETTGEVEITKLPAEDLNAQGTDIVIDELLQRTRDEFRSRDLWELIRSSPEEVESGGVNRPPFHIGFLDVAKPDKYIEKPSVPWDPDDDALERFRKLARSMFDRVNGVGADRKPSLATTFDNYFRFLWFLSLSAPIDYIDKHPFDLDKSAGLRVFKFGKIGKGRAEEIELRAGETIRERLDLKAPERGGNPDFNVIIDGLELRRPIRFTGLPETSNKLKTPLLFVGTDAPDMAKYDDRKTGGPLRFEGYLLWCPRVVPVEHNGVLLRVGDASGSLFDSTFMKYQISEQTRRDQVTSEIFVHEGMDAALNVDRESFNHAHPHYQYIAAWMHDAFKQFATKHKSLGGEARKKDLVTAHHATKERLSAVVEEIIEEWTGGDESPVKVEFLEDGQSRLFKPREKETVLVFSQSEVFANYPLGERTGAKKALRFSTDEEKLKAITQVLYAAGVFDRIGRERQQRLLRDLARVIFFVGGQ